MPSQLLHTELEKSEQERLHILLQTARALGFVVVSSFKEALQTPYAVFINGGEKSIEINHPNTIIPAEIEAFILDFRQRGYAVFFISKILHQQTQRET